MCSCHGPASRSGVPVRRPGSRAGRRLGRRSAAPATQPRLDRARQHPCGDAHEQEPSRHLSHRQHAPGLGACRDVPEADGAERGQREVQGIRPGQRLAEGAPSRSSWSEGSRATARAPRSSSSSRPPRARPPGLRTGRRPREPWPGNPAPPARPTDARWWSGPWRACGPVRWPAASPPVGGAQRRGGLRAAGRAGLPHRAPAADDHRGIRAERGAGPAGRLGPCGSGVRGDTLDEVRRTFSATGTTGRRRSRGRGGDPRVRRGVQPRAPGGLRTVPAPAPHTGAGRGLALAALAVSGLALGEYVASSPWYRTAAASAVSRPDPEPAAGARPSRAGPPAGSPAPGEVTRPRPCPC
ncbi:hypothetical protein QF034_004273 [Streptomyces africanus]|uniref:Uncharacterized protein n=1 Tax=Streptomyces africanus TaxID=231024 RepID=A0ABU0QUJ5_9ACTN|nr:hypothetical protein [Streptomyces africanus]